jgi:hypothetical protein
VAQKIQTLYIDDLDGGEAEGTVRYGLDGTDCEIDLSAKNEEALRSALERYIAAARRALLDGQGDAHGRVATPEPTRLRFG